MSLRLKRGPLARRFEILAQLRVLLRAEVVPERMLRSVAVMLAQYFDFCVADIVDARGELRRVEIAHADPGRRERLRVLADETRHPPDSRVAILLTRGGSEHIARVSRATRARLLGDLVLLGEPIASEMAVTLVLNGAPMAVLTLLSTSPRHIITGDDLVFMKGAAEWIALGLENATRSQVGRRASVVPAARALKRPVQRSGRGAHVRA